MCCLKGGLLIIEEEKQVGTQAAEQNASLLMASTLLSSILPDHFSVSVLRTLECHKTACGLTDIFELMIQLHTQADQMPMYMCCICWLLLANT